MGLTSVTTTALPVFRYFYSNKCFLHLVHRQRYRVPLKSCSTPRFQISSKAEVHLGIFSGLYMTWEPKGDVRYSKNIREMETNILTSTGGPASFSHFPKDEALGSC